MSQEENDDHYLFLEDRESDEARNFAHAANQACLSVLGDPSTSKKSTYPKILEVLEADDRIPFVSKMGTDESGQDLLYNFWRDASEVCVIFCYWKSFCFFFWVCLHCFPKPNLLFHFIVFFCFCFVFSASERSLANDNNVFV